MAAIGRLYGDQRALHGLLWPDRAGLGGLGEIGNRGSVAAGNAVADGKLHPAAADRKPDPNRGHQPDFGPGRSA